MRHRDTTPRRAVPSVPRWNNTWLHLHLLAASIHDLAPQLRGKRLLDIGCGNKPYRPWLTNVGSYVGIDIMADNSAADVVSTVTHLPFRTAAFDSVICTQVLEHVQEPGALLAEAFRVLTPGGRLLLSAPMYWRHHEEPFDFFRYTRYGLEYLLGEAGFRIEQLVQQGGAWHVVGQALANTLVSAMSFRTYGFKALLLLLINSLFDWLDRIDYHPEDTANFVVLARKNEAP